MAVARWVSRFKHGTEDLQALQKTRKPIFSRYFSQLIIIIVFRLTDVVFIDDFKSGEILLTKYYADNSLKTSVNKSY